MQQQQNAGMNGGARIIARLTAMMKHAATLRHTQLTPVQELMPQVHTLEAQENNNTQ